MAIIITLALAQFFFTYDLLSLLTTTGTTSSSFVNNPSPMSLKYLTENAPPDLSFSADDQDDVLELCEDLFTPEENAKLDSELRSTWANIALGNPTIMGHILSDILSSAGFRMSQQLIPSSACKPLCEKNLQLRQALTHAAAEGSFGRIRRLGERISKSLRCSTLMNTTAILRIPSNDAPKKVVSQCECLDFLLWLYLIDFTDSYITTV